MAHDHLPSGDSQIATAGSNQLSLPPEVAANNQANGADFAHMSGTDRGSNGSVPPATFDGDHINFSATADAGKQGGGFWNGVGNAIEKTDNWMYKNLGLGDSDAPVRSGQAIEMPGSKDN